MEQIPELIIWGISDSLSPVYVAILAWFTAACISLSGDRKAMLFFGIYFILVFYTLGLLLLMGYFNSLVYVKWFPDVSRVVFMLLGLWLLWAGLKLFARWIEEFRGSAEEKEIDLKILPLSWILHAPTAIIAAMALAYVSMIWAPTQYVTFLATQALLPGKGWDTFGSMAFYFLFKNLSFVLILIGAFSIAKKQAGPKKKIIRTSMVYIILAAFFIAIGSGILIIFLQFI